MAYTMTVDIKLGSAKAGLTLNAQLMDITGSFVGSEITAGFVELGNGDYGFSYDQYPDDFRGYVRFYEFGSPGIPLTTLSVNPEELEYTNRPMEVMEAVMLGKSDGGTTDTIRFWSPDGSKLLVTGTVDQSTGDRQVITITR